MEFCTHQKIIQIRDNTANILRISSRGHLLQTIELRIAALVTNCLTALSFSLFENFPEIDRGDQYQAQTENNQPKVIHSIGVRKLPASFAIEASCRSQSSKFLAGNLSPSL